VDELFGQNIRRTLTKYLPMQNDTSLVSTYPDLFAFAITVCLAVMLALGVRESTRFNSIFTAINLTVVAAVVALGAGYINVHNWQLTASEVANATAGWPTQHGTGGFAPFGFSGIMAGAATCFYAFIGFDVIATTGEEVRRPQRAIPIAIVVSLALVFVAYFAVSCVQTLLWPYYDQARPAPLPYVFEQAGMPWARYAITLGALAGLSTSLLGAMFPLPRILYAMATDGLLFASLASVSDRWKTPALATIVSGVFAGLMALLFNIDELADMMSIGTLLAYTLVALSVLMLR
jgi:cationic amino acid transporter 3